MFTPQILDYQLSFLVKCVAALQYCYLALLFHDAITASPFVRNVTAFLLLSSLSDCTSNQVLSAVALSTVLWTVHLKYKKRPFPTIQRKKTLKPISAKLCTIDYVDEVTQKGEGRRRWRPHMCDIYNYA